MKIKKKKKERKDSFLTPECRLPGKRRDSLVDGIFNGIYLGNGGKSASMLL